MEVFYDGVKIDLNNTKLISDKGSEFLVYQYLDYVLKIYKNDYKLTHLSLDELLYLINIPTDRILMPSVVLKDENDTLVGYSMPFIKNRVNIFEQKIIDLIIELEIIEKDILLLSSRGVALRDINASNTIFNGNLFLIDPGNYLVNNLDKVIFHVDVNKLNENEKLRELQKWNYDKVNKLIEMMLFSHIEDFYIFRLIVQFFERTRSEIGTLFDLDVFKYYFDKNLSVIDAIEKFIKNNIKEDPVEKEYFLSLIKRDKSIETYLKPNY